MCRRAIVKGETGLRRVMIGTQTILVALGANLTSPAGPPRQTLEAALAALDAGGLRVCARSRWYRSPAFPPGSGPDFVNGAAVLQSPLAPEAVLAALHAVERDLGRERGRRWAPRACDIDFLAWGDAVRPDRPTITTWMNLAPREQRRRAPTTLLLPHPRLHERAFVLLPLAEVAPDWEHPILRRSVSELAAGLSAEAASGVGAL